MCVWVFIKLFWDTSDSSFIGDLDPKPPSDSCREFACICPSVSDYVCLSRADMMNFGKLELYGVAQSSAWIHARGSPWGQSVTRGECVLRNLPDRHPGNCVEGRPRNAGIPGGFIFVGKGDKSRGGEGRGNLHVFWEGAAVRNKSKKQTKSQTLDTVSLTHHTCPCHTRFDLWPSIPNVHVIVGALSEDEPSPWNH